MAWKKHIDTAHTAGAPPSFGSAIFANRGCTENNSSADTNKVIAKVQSRPPVANAVAAVADDGVDGRAGLRDASAMGGVRFLGSSRKLRRAADCAKKPLTTS
jgi:hypothetical protein